MAGVTALALLLILMLGCLLEFGVTIFLIVRSFLVVSLLDVAKLWSHEGLIHAHLVQWLQTVSHHIRVRAGLSLLLP